MKPKKLLFIVALIIIFSTTYAQNSTQTDINQAAVSKSGTSFLLTGYGFTGFEFLNMLDDQGNSLEKESTFGETSFVPIFLWRPSDKLFFEAELEFELAGNELEVVLEYVNVSYILNKYMTLRAGKFLTPFGTFVDRLHPAWINKLVSKPLGFGHGAVGPSSEVGVELRGGLQLGHSKMNYSFYISNGPTLNTGDEDAVMAGTLNYDNFEDNNLNKAVGARIGFLPLSNSSLELGLSFQNSVVGEADNTINSIPDAQLNDIKAKMLALDFSFIRPVEFIKSNVDIKGQFNQVRVDDAEYFDPEDLSYYSFDNLSTAYFMQIAIRPSMTRNKFLRKLEFVGRYSSLELPEESKWGEVETQTTIGVNYWFTWRSALKFNYQLTREDGINAEKAFLVQWAIGF